MYKLVKKIIKQVLLSIFIISITIKDILHCSTAFLIKCRWHNRFFYNINLIDVFFIFDIFTLSYLARAGIWGIRSLFRRASDIQRSLQFSSSLYISFSFLLSVKSPVYRRENLIEKLNFLVEIKWNIVFFFIFFSPICIISLFLSLSFRCLPINLPLFLSLSLSLFIHFLYLSILFLSLSLFIPIFLCLSLSRHITTKIDILFQFFWRVDNWWVLINEWIVLKRSEPK